MNGAGIQARRGNLVVARFLDGKIVRGKTYDFNPARPGFRVYDGGDTSSPPIEVATQSLKAIFFVKSLAGDGEHGGFSFDHVTGRGLRAVVMFKDLEMIAGMVNECSPDKPGFFLTPAQRDGNNRRVFVPWTATRQIRWL